MIDKLLCVNRCFKPTCEIISCPSNDQRKSWRTSIAFVLSHIFFLFFTSTRCNGHTKIFMRFLGRSLLYLPHSMCNTLRTERIAIWMTWVYCDWSQAFRKVHCLYCTLIVKWSRCHDLNSSFFSFLSLLCFHYERNREKI